MFLVAAPPPMAGFVTPMAPQMNAHMGMGVKHPNENPVPEEEPANKKLRNEDSLVPEAVFLARNTVIYSSIISSLSLLYKNNLSF